MSLVYLGISLKNAIANPLADKLNFVSNEDLNKSKISHDEYPMLLDALLSLSYVQEVCMASTCNRFEIFIYSNCDLQQSYHQDKIHELNHTIQSINGSNVEFKALYGDDVRHQFFRTYSGLNSGLIGEDEICSQYEISFAQSKAMGYAHENLASLIVQARILRHKINSNFYQRNYSYCGVAINEAFQKLQVCTASLNKVCILGSGNTAFSSAMALIEKGLDPKKLYLAHRISSSSKQIAQFKDEHKLWGMNFFRSKYGYHTDKVRAVIADSDLVIFGIDSKNPIINFGSNSKAKIIDFNSKDSCTFESVRPGNNQYLNHVDLDRLVRIFAEAKLADPDFKQTIIDIENLIESSFEINKSAQRKESMQEIFSI